jgi:hypothetical protein
VLGLLVHALFNQGYDRFVKWPDAKQANRSALSSGVTTAQFFSAENMDISKGCLYLKRGSSLVAAFTINAIPGTPYFNMTPYALDFVRSKAKEQMR